MTDFSSAEALGRAAEKYFGIKADHDDAEKLRQYIIGAYGSADGETVNRVFSSGEASDFLTVNETYFFRESAHFYFLRDLLPGFTRKEIRVCSAAVSCGCEAYSIAMLIEAYNRGTEKPLRYHIDAFDINPRVIEAANLGIFGERTLREDGSCFRCLADPYLKKIESAAGVKYGIDPSLKKNISFFVHNLMEKLPAKEYDLIFFRNAFIYFTPGCRERILTNLIGVLEEGGYLIMGVSETAGVRHSGIEGRNRNDVFYFRKPSNRNLFTETGL